MRQKRQKEVNTMERYEVPEMEIVLFDTEDVITTSGILIEDGDED